MTGNVQTYTHFLRRDPLYATEKPYSLRLTPPTGFPRTNIKLEKRDIKIRNIRGPGSKPSFEEDGCSLLDLRTEMQHADFDDEEKIKEIYLKEVANCLKTFLGAQHVQIFEHTVRKRHDIFPISTGQPYKYNQPTSIAHVDTTLSWALAMARQLNPDRIEKILKHRVQCVNFWKPLSGPVKDWPLALCSPRTVKPERDFEPCDLVYPDYVVENRQVYHSTDYDWFYVSDQRPHEAWVFLQSDTETETKPVMHTSFPLAGADSPIPPRESIEARALVYYGGFDDNQTGQQSSAV